MPSPTAAEKIKQWMPIILLAAAGISSSSVSGYQIIDLRERMDKQETAQVQQVRLEEQTDAIKDDVADLEEDVEEVNGKLDAQSLEINSNSLKLDLILQRLPQ